MKNYTGGTIELLLSGDIQTGATTFFFIPIFPIRRYRVIDTGGGYKFLGKAPLRTFDKWHIAVSIGIILWIVANF